MICVSVSEIADARVFTKMWGFLSVPDLEDASVPDVEDMRVLVSTWRKGCEGLCVCTWRGVCEKAAWWGGPGAEFAAGWTVPVWKWPRQVHQLQSPGAEAACSDSPAPRPSVGRLCSDLQQSININFNLNTQYFLSDVCRVYIVCHARAVPTNFPKKGPTTILLWGNSEIF